MKSRIENILNFANYRHNKLTKIVICHCLIKKIAKYRRSQ